MSREAEARIARARRDNEPTLDLGGLGLRELPPSLADCTRLTELDLSGNRLTDLPEWLGGLTALTTLDLWDNHLVALPELIGNLANLTHLGLGNNRLTALPDWLGDLTGLRELDLGNNRLVRLPESLGNLIDLTILQLGSLGLTELPGWLTDLTDLDELNLSRNELAALPESVGNLTNLTSLDLSNNRLSDLPHSIANLGKLTSLYVGGNQITHLPTAVTTLVNLTALDVGTNRLEALPESLGNLTNLTTLALSGNKLSHLPQSLGNLGDLDVLRASDNQLSELPESLGNLTNLTNLDLSDNRLAEPPRWLGSLASLRILWLDGCPRLETAEWIGGLRDLENLSLGSCDLAEVPPWLVTLKGLTSLYLERNRIRDVPEWIGELTELTDLWLQNNEIGKLPERLGDLAALNRLWLSDNRISELPESIGGLTRLIELRLGNNLLCGLPFSLADLSLRNLDLTGNPLAPELLAAYQDSNDELRSLLRLLRDEGQFVREAKLVLVGEGEVGKSSLLAALRGEPWVEHRSTTHGIEVKPVQVGDPDEPITLNGWDFGGQPVYRPTHQLFFTTPAVYLIVWKPREGPEQGFVDYWAQLIQHRAGEDARILVVATHGGPLQRSAYLDESALRDRYGDMIAGFFHVDSRTGLNVDRLRAAIADTAATLTHLGRWYPSSWQRLRARLREEGEPYLPYPAYERIATGEGLSPTSARSLAKNAHALGYWIHSADEPGLADLVIFKADWLATAVSLILDDPDTIRANGLLPHRRLPSIWDNPAREPSQRYPRAVHSVFVQLMEKFDISYRVADGSDRDEPMSLIAQLVRTDRPDLGAAWHDYGTDLEERSLICEITESGTDMPAVPEGLMYQLIVRFHRYSLGRTDHRASVHWRNGVVLDGNHHGRALVTMERNRVTVTVRAAYPQFMLHQLSEDIREHVQAFWRGLTTTIKIPCTALCEQPTPGLGLFDIDKLISSRRKRRDEYPCPACHEWCDIDSLLLGADRADTVDERLVRAIHAAVRPEFTRMIAVVDQQTRAVSGALDQLALDTQAAISQAEDHLRDLIIAFDDEAREGPRLFTLARVDPTPLRPGWTKQRVRLDLWCEHSRLPLHVLNRDGGPSGSYDIDVPREWLVKAAPWINAVSTVIRTLVPVSLAGLKLDLTDQQWADVGKQLELAEKALTSVAGAADTLAAGADASADPVPGEAPDGSLLRTVHAILKERDPSYAGLERVKVRQRYLWVHPRFANLYRTTEPHIPGDS